MVHHDQVSDRSFVLFYKSLQSYKISPVKGVAALAINLNNAAASIQFLRQ